MKRQAPGEAVAAWNVAHPIGTKVRRYSRMHPRREPVGETETVTEAWVMGGHSPVVKVKDGPGAIHLDALEPLKGEP